MIIGAFEVFAFSRDEEDFIENLKLIAEFAKHGKVSATGRKKKKSSIEKDSVRQALAMFEDVRKHFSDREAELVDKLIKTDYVTVMGALEVYALTKDKDDLTHTLKLLLKFVDE